MQNRCFLFLFSIILPVASFAQRDFKLKETYTVNISTADTTIKAEVFYIPKNITGEKEVLYYWYTPNKIIATQGAYQGKLLDGQYSVIFNNTNNLKEKGVFENGIKTGEWLSWHSNGLIKESFNWRKGKLNGTFKKYAPDGKLVTLGKYTNNLLNGNLYMYNDGKLVQSRKYKKGVEIVKNNAPFNDTTKLQMNKTDTVTKNKKRAIANPFKKKQQKVTIPQNK